MARMLLRDLTPNTTYYVQFRAVDGSSVSDWSRRFTLATTADTTPPDVPLWAVSNEFVVADDTFIATWQPVDENLDQNKDFSYYELNITDGIKTVTVITNNTSYTLTYDQNRAFFGTAKASITVKLRAFDKTGNASAYTATRSATNPVPANVASVTVTALYDAIQVDWPKVADTDVNTYRVQLSTTGVGGTYNTVYQGSENTYTQPSTNYATDHFFKVVAIDKFGSVSAVAVTSGAVRPKSTFSLDTTAPANPTWSTLTTTFDTTNQQSYFTATWTANAESDMSVYVLRYGLDGSTWEYVTIPFGTNTAKVVVDPGKSYYFQLAARDLSGNVSGYTNAPAAYPRPSAADSTAPSTPSAPTVSVSLGAMQAQVSHPGTKAAGGTMEIDTVSYQVFAGTAASPTTLIGTLDANASNKTAVGSFMLPASGGTATQTWYFRVKAVDSSGNISASYSADATGTVGLILGANIVDATITNAKINDLSATKITAGTISAQTINIGSTGVLNIDSTGVIKSNNWSSGTAGYRLTNTALEINNGSISAAALNIQDSDNLMHPAYADFEWLSTFYTGQFTNSNATPTIDSTDFYVNSQSLKIVTTNVSNSVYLGATATTYTTLRLEPSTTYIVSYYAMIKSGATAGTITPSIRTKKAAGDDTTANGAGANVSGGSTTVAADSAWKRYYAAITTPAAATGQASLLFASSVATTYYIDGIQVERKIGAINTPSQWTPPGATTIDGGMIRTGSIRSNTDLTVGGQTLPTWSISTSGAAQFGDLLIRGNVVVGQHADEGEDSRIQSFNYVAGTDGWRITSGGSAEFRNVVIGSPITPVDATNIKDGTLRAQAIQAGSILTEDIDITGSMTAYGIKGENVILGGDGFTVLGAYQVYIASVAQSGTTVTVTTQVAHGFTAGNTLSVNGLSAIAVYLDSNNLVIDATPTTTTFTYTVATSATISTTASTGIAKSFSTAGAPNAIRPVLINFPTDGTNPNIISGTLSADTLVVSVGASLSGNTNLELNSNTVLTSATLAPKSAPVITQFYNDLQFTGGAVSKTTRGMCKGHNGNWFLLILDAAAEEYYIQEFDATTKAFIATRVTETYSDTTVALGKTYQNTYNPMSLTYVASKSMYYVCELRGFTIDGAFQNGANGVNAYTQGTWALNGVTHANWPTRASTWGTATIGNDFVNGGLCWAGNEAGTVRYRTITLDGPGTTLTWSSAGTFTGMSSTLNDPGCIVRLNDLDNIARDRIIIKNRSYGTTAWTQQWLPWSVSSNVPSAIQTNEQWDAAYGYYVNSMWYDTTNKVIHGQMSAGIKAEYASGDSFWSDVSAQTKTTWVGYSWYDSDTADPDGAGPITGATHETNLGPRAQVNLKKRATMKFTISNIPYITGNVESPNRARIYVATNATEPSLATGSVDTKWHLRTEIMYPSRSDIIVPVASPSGAQPKGASSNEFLTSSFNTPAALVSSSVDTNGDPLVRLKGDGGWNLSNASKRLGKDIRTSSGSTISSGSSGNVGSVTVALVAGHIYRAYWQGNLNMATSGGYTVLDIKHGVSAVTGGTVMGRTYWDCRLGGRIIGATCVGEFIAATTQTENIVAVMAPNATSGATYSDGTAGAYSSMFWVEEVFL